MVDRHTARQGACRQWKQRPGTGRHMTGYPPWTPRNEASVGLHGSSIVQGEREALVKARARNEETPGQQIALPGRRYLANVELCSSARPQQVKDHRPADGN